MIPTGQIHKIWVLLLCGSVVQICVYSLSESNNSLHFFPVISVHVRESYIRFHLIPITSLSVLVRKGQAVMVIPRMWVRTIFSSKKKKKYMKFLQFADNLTHASHFHGSFYMVVILSGTRVFEHSKIIHQRLLPNTSLPWPQRHTHSWESGVRATVWIDE